MLLLTPLSPTYIPVGVEICNVLTLWFCAVTVTGFAFGWGQPGEGTHTQGPFTIRPERPSFVLRGHDSYCGALIYVGPDLFRGALIHPEDFGSSCGALMFPAGR